jgi:hypothetical protein
MDDLTKELASLRLDDEPPRSRRRAWVASVLVVFIGAAGTVFWWGPATLTATEVDTTTPRVERTGEAPSGSPLLTASGYVGRPPQAVVSAKIQGRLAEIERRGRQPGA